MKLPTLAIPQPPAKRTGFTLPGRAAQPLIKGITPAVRQAARDDADAQDILVDEDHANGPIYTVRVNINDGFVEETCRVHAAYPGLACNRAWKLVADKHKRSLGRRAKQTVVFTTEVD